MLPEVPEYFFVCSSRLELNQIVFKIQNRSFKIQNRCWRFGMKLIPSQFKVKIDSDDKRRQILLLCCTI